MCHFEKCVYPSTVPGYEYVLFCDHNPCLNNGTCVTNSLTTTFICNCASGFGGSVVDFLKINLNKLILI